jgi:tetrahydromethanopterin S-methyltransferase subunit G
MDNEELFKFMEKMYNEMQNGFKKVDTRLDKLEYGQKKIEINLEELDKKVDASLEGHKTNTEQLNRIEAKVSTHE